MTLPNGWIATSLQVVTRSDSPICYGVLKPGALNPGGVRMVRVTDIRSNVLEEEGLVTITDDLDAEFRRSRLLPGDVLISVQGTVGRVAVVPDTLQKANISRTIARLRLVDGIEPRWLWRAMRAPQFQKIVGGEIAGTTRDSLNIGALRELNVPIPPTAEQRRIVEKLDTLAARLTRARAELDRVPALAEHLRATVSAKVFAEQSGHPAELGSLMLPTAPIRYGVLQPGDEKGTGIPMIRVCDLHGMRVRWPALRRIAPEIDRQFASARVHDDDVLISVVGTIGRIAIVRGLTEPTNIARAVARLRPDTGKVLPMWLALRLAAPDCQKTFAGDAREVARKTLNVSLIKAVRIKLPSLSAQAEAVRTIGAALARADRLESEAARARALIDRLESAILARAFRGELVPQDPNDEPASVLLDRIRAQRAAAPSAKRGSRKRIKEAAP